MLRGDTVFQAVRNMDTLMLELTLLAQWNHYILSLIKLSLLWSKHKYAFTQQCVSVTTRAHLGSCLHSDITPAVILMSFQLQAPNRMGGRGFNPGPGNEPEKRVKTVKFPVPKCLLIIQI